MKKLFGKKMILGLLLAVGMGFSSYADIDIKLLFSTDDGKTFTEDFPIVQKGGEVLIKVKYEVVNEYETIKNNVLTTLMFNTERDFASAKTGKQNWGGEGWFQRLKKYYASPKRPGTFLYRLDLGKRAADTMGFKNKYNKEKKQFIDGPLPACPAIEPGDYNFIVRISYRLQDTGKAVNKSSLFTVTVK